MPGVEAAVDVLEPNCKTKKKTKCQLPVPIPFFDKCFFISDIPAQSSLPAFSVFVVFPCNQQLDGGRRLGRLGDAEMVSRGTYKAVFTDELLV